MSIEEVIKLLKEDRIKLIQDAIDNDNLDMLMSIINNCLESDTEFAMVHYANYYVGKEYPDSDIAANMIMKLIDKDKIFFKKLMRWVTKEKKKKKRKI